MGWRAERCFASTLETPAEGRSFILATLNEWLSAAPSVCSDCELIASELLTNSVKAGASTVTVTLTGNSAVLRLEVSDDGGGTPTVRSPGEQDTSGRGLLIVAALADRWAIDVRPAERTAVWVELQLSRAASPAPRTSSP